MLECTCLHKHLAKYLILSASSIEKKTSNKEKNEKKLTPLSDQNTTELKLAHASKLSRLNHHVAVQLKLHLQYRQCKCRLEMAGFS